MLAAIYEDLAHVIANLGDFTLMTIMWAFFGDGDLASDFQTNGFATPLLGLIWRVGKSLGRRGAAEKTKFQKGKKKTSDTERKKRGKGGTCGQSSVTWNPWGCLGGLGRQDSYA